MQNHAFLHKIIRDLLAEYPDLSEVKIVLPGKRPVVFIKDILHQNNYEGFLPEFVSIKDLIVEIADLQLFSGVGLWLFSYQNYAKLFPEESLDSFLKWFPFLLKDWDDMLKFCDSDNQVIHYMLSEERMKNWAFKLGEPTEKVIRNLDFWKRMSVFLPYLKEELLKKNWANEGLIHQFAKNKIDDFARKSKQVFVFCGFNALTPVEQILIKSLMQFDKAKVYFHADTYYVSDDKQEAGNFLREMKSWKEFNPNRPFNWLESDFEKAKSIKLYNASGDVTQAKFLSAIFDELLQEIPDDEIENEISQTALVLLDEKMLPLVIENLHPKIDAVNITMGYPIQNLEYSIFFRKIIYLHKHLNKKPNKYYFSDILGILESFPLNENDEFIYKNFLIELKKRNWVYISRKQIEEHLGELSFVDLLYGQALVTDLIPLLLNFCAEQKNREISSILFENLSLFEKDFKAIYYLLESFDYPISMESFEVLMNFYLKNESVDFEGKPLKGLQIMGLLETRLLNFKNLIFLSLNEGKLPLGNTQNSMIPFDVKKHENMNTFLENDSIYAYHFYRLLQKSENVYLMYNSNASGLNSGEKSRFIRQIESESSHKIEYISINNSPIPIENELREVQKTEFVMNQLEKWKKSISPTHLTTYLYNPINFYMNRVLEIRSENEIEEDMSSKNFGNLVHCVLEKIYTQWIGEFLKIENLKSEFEHIAQITEYEIVNKLKHQSELYQNGMNFFFKKMAVETVEKILKKDIAELKNGVKIKILALEVDLESKFSLLEEYKPEQEILFRGKADRIDERDGVLTIIDYKSKTEEGDIKMNNKTIKFDASKKFQLQLGFYAYCILNASKKIFPHTEVQCGIWGFDQPEKGISYLWVEGEKIIGNQEIQSISYLIHQLLLEILNPEIPFIEIQKMKF